MIIFPNFPNYPPTIHALKDTVYVTTEHDPRDLQFLSQQRGDSICRHDTESAFLINAKIPMDDRNDATPQGCGYGTKKACMNITLQERHETHRSQRNER